MRGAVLDVVAVAGAASVVYGLSIIHPALAWTVGGALALAFALVANRRAAT